MNQKINLAFIFSFLCLLAIITSCNKDNIDNMGIEEDDVVATVDSCLMTVDLLSFTDSMGMFIVSANVTGGDAPYIYEWSTGETTNQITVAESGTYSVSVTDAVGCIVAITEEVDGTNTDPCNGLVGNIEVITDSVGVVAIISAVVSGGTAPYTYEWLTGETTSNIQITQSGTYSVVITDAEGCGLALEYNYGTGTDPCNGLAVNIASFPDSMGVTILYATISGGTAPYTYMWSDNTFGSQIEVTQSGTYSVMITDAAGCTVSVTYEHTGTGTDPCNGFAANITASLDSTGSTILTVLVSGGTAPYTYTWSNGMQGNSIVINASGTYVITVVDAAGCSLTIIYDHIEADPCNGFTTTIGSLPDSMGVTVLYATIIGGNAPYTYEWSTGELANYIEVTQGGTYSVTITDAEGCTTSTSFVYPGPGGNPCDNFTLDLQTSINPNGVTIITANASGGTIPYAYQWSTNEFTNQIQVTTGGNYSVSVTDANGCIVIGNIVL